MRTIIIAAALLTATSPAFAEPILVDASAPSARVSYADLDVLSTAGRQALEARVRSAAQALCYSPGKTDLDRALAGKKCFASAMAGARDQIDAAVLSSRAFASSQSITVAAR